jgi:diguanylate cyclase (GGDEF)-like protein
VAPDGGLRGERATPVDAPRPNAILTLLDTRLRDAPPTDAAQTELLAEVLDIPIEAAMALPPEPTRRALARLQVLVGRLTSAAATDELTGCLQRDAGLAAIAREMERAGRTGSRMVLLSFSVDSLRQVCRDHGPEAGDAMLQATAEALRRHFRGYDLMVRDREHEFICALPDADITSAHERVEVVCKELSQDQRCWSRLLTSVGLAELREGDTLHGLLSRADADLTVDQRRRRSQPRAPTVD